MDTLTAASQTTATDSPKTTCDDHQQLLIVLKHNELNSTKNSHHAKIPSISTPAVLNIYIVAIKKGKFKAKATFMCAEYENPDKIELTFICE